MAPTSPIKRVTRARAAAKTTKEEPAPKKLGTTKVTKTAAPKAATKPTKSTTRKAQPVDESDDELMVADPPKKAIRATTKPVAPLAAAPRRRVKVTPLDAPVVEEPAPEPEPEKPKRKTATRAKKAADTEDTDVADTAPPVATTRTRTTRTAATVTSAAKNATSKTTKAEPTASKTRGRPKKNAEAEQIEEPAPQPTKITRQTRSRSASVASQQPAELAPHMPKTKAAARKKVTFQDVSEDDKENEPVAPRRAAAKKAAPTTGMRAKPVRKPAAAVAKKSTTTRTRAVKAAPRALTPKKVTQVQRSDIELDSEDELSGSKTPVRDLSLSPKRNPNLAASLSPAKKLDFTQLLKATSPQKPSANAMLMSPARRPASPVKGSDVTVAAALGSAPAPGLNESPKRGVPDTSIFGNSVMKPQKSPLKESLMQSPARRLFSPAKQKTPLSVHRDAETHNTGLESLEDITVSSHFRPSMSPQRSGRVHRMSDEELADELAMDMDFDQSVLKLTSPKKSPVKAFKPVISEALDEEPQMQVIQNDVEETAKAVEELQDVVETEEDDTEVLTEMAETIEPAQVSLTTSDESSEENGHEFVKPAPQGRGKAPRLSQILFRSNRVREEDESSEDELAADQTPDRAPRLFRSSMTGNNTRSRLSMGVNQASSGKVGFTPLAAQMSGWLATSPEKSPNKQAVLKKTPSKGLFSPLAAQHIAGEIQISRQFTPRQNQSPGFRTSVNSRPSMTSAVASPEKSSFFAEQMSGMEDDLAEDSIMSHETAEVEQDEATSDTVVAAENAAIFNGLQQMEESSAFEAEAEADDDTVITSKPADELTTDLVNEIHASDTAMVEFQELAHEADAMADVEPSSPSVYGDENANPEDTLNLSVMERERTPEEQTLNLHVLEQDDEEESLQATPQPTHVPSAAEEPTLNFHVLEKHSAPASATPVSRALLADGEPTLNLDVLERTAAPTPVPKGAQSIDDQTLNLQVLEDNVLAETGGDRSLLVAGNTPEGSPEPTASPVRAVPSTVPEDVATPVTRVLGGPRLFNTVVSKVPLKPEGDVSPIKMPKKRSRSMSMSKQQSPPKRPQLTPNGKLAARSTSEPHLSPERQVRSIGPSPAQTTPGQMSFAIDDFGDSTLDGIELPDDEMDFDVGRPVDTPASAKSSNVKSTASKPRAPLETVGKGVLHGAVVFVEVHTSEGADASGVYIDLLTEMGARCVKEWRWNPRTSIHGGDDLAGSSRIGITHVVYKDGGKRTLEKVRDAKGEVLCVGVRWVLDCEREGKWVDESPYIVDHGVLPRGGSRRRKSMEPKALMNANGNIRAGRRSTSAEYMTTEMREELINTPVRSYQPPVTAPRESIGLESVADSEISSTYNSPTTTMNVRYVATPTALVGWDPATSKTPAKAGNPEMDTPYLMKQGGMIMDHARDSGAMSAPPKQINKGLFDKDGEDDGVNKGEKLKLKLNEARRRTMGFKPVIGSPLGKF